jgi:hypothetical protein
VLNVAIVWRGYSCEAGLALLVVHRVKTLWLRLARNDRKRHYPRCRAGVVVFVVAQQVQDLSAVSFAHKTVGIRLPRLRCGAGLVPALRISGSSKTGVFFILPFVWW